jgi:hypothetical protein
MDPILLVNDFEFGPNDENGIQIMDPLLDPPFGSSLGPFFRETR